MENQLIVGDSATQAYAKLLRTLLEQGEPSKPRGMVTRELRPVVTRINGPRRWVGQPTRHLSIALGVLEALQTVGGFSAPATLVKVAPQYARFTDPGTGKLDGAYGPRLAPQLGYLRRLLRQDPDSRQAVATIYGPQDHRTSLDVPCTVSLQFFLRSTAPSLTFSPSGDSGEVHKGRELELVVYMRSNDAWLGWPYDVVQFSAVQAAFAADLGVSAGRYTHIAGSMHLYERNAKAAQEVAEDERDEGPSPPTLPMPRDFEATALEARAVVSSWWRRLGSPYSPWDASELLDGPLPELQSRFATWCFDRLNEA